MINGFGQYLIEEERVVYFAFGRMNPPTIGHGKLLDVLAAKAGRNPYKLFLSQSQDAKSNPLAYSDKIKNIRKMFPKHARNIMVDKKVKTPFDVLTVLYDQGFRKIVMVAGSDRVTEYDLRLNKYNGKQSAHGFYNFQNGIKIVSAGQRDPDAEGAEGASGTKQRGFASDNDFIKFSQGLPAAMNTKDARLMFNAVRKGMGLKEEKHFKNHIQLEPVSAIRESYIRDNVFELGEEVLLNRKDGIIGTIQHLGSNYLIVESKGERWRCWLDDVSKLNPNETPSWDTFNIGATPEKGVIREAAGDLSGTPNLNKYFKKRQDMEKKHSKIGVAFEGKSMYADKPDWGTPESTEKAKAMTPGQASEGKNGLWDNIHARRKKGLRALRPGEKGYPKTLNTEQNEMEKARATIARDKQQATNMIAREKDKDKQKHDRILDQARRAVAMRKNKGTNV